MRLAKTLTPICIVLLLFAALNAEKSESKKSETTVSETTGSDLGCPLCTDACASECTSCELTKAMEALPQLVYKIGDESTTSPVQAGRLARKANLKVQFTVLGKVFKDEVEAFAALVDETEKFVNDFAKPKKCETSGQTLVAGKSLCCEEAANEVASVVKKAMDSVQVTYKVGKTSVCCPDEAKALAQKSGEKVVKLVAGQECGGCGSTNRLTLARAKYKAAIEALLAANEDDAVKDNAAAADA